MERLPCGTSTNAQDANLFTTVQLQKVTRTAGEPATSPLPLIVCVDVDYRTEGAVAAAIWFRGWNAAVAETQATASFTHVADYEPGEFYRRELPCLLGALEKGPVADIVVVDGYVWLEPGKKGLGAHLYDIIVRPVVGVAKTRYASAVNAIAVCRGGSKSPLYVSTAGISPEDAARHLVEMHGPYRVPTLLKQVDSLARSASFSAIGEA